MKRLSPEERHLAIERLQTEEENPCAGTPAELLADAVRTMTDITCHLENILARMCGERQGEDDALTVVDLGNGSLADVLERAPEALDKIYDQQAELIKKIEGILL